MADTKHVCPTCGQPTPPPTYRVQSRTLRLSYMVPGALAWFDDGEEGATVGEGARKNTTAELAHAVARYRESPTPDRGASVDFWAVECASAALAEKLGAESTPRGLRWARPRDAKRALVAWAEIKVGAMLADPAT